MGFVVLITSVDTVENRGWACGRTEVGCLQDVYSVWWPLGTDVEENPCHSVRPQGGKGFSS